jgi:hypothetical protein
MDDNKPSVLSPQNNTPQAKGLRTGLQAVAGSIVGLLAVVWAVPGVPEAVNNYIGDNVLPLALAIGIPSGIAGLLYNLFFKRKG